MVFGTKTKQFKVSSTKDHLSKFKSFFKKNKDENSKKVNSPLVAHVTSVVYHETKPFPKVEKAQTIRPAENCSFKNKFKSLFAIKKKDEYSPVVKKQPSGMRRKELFNKIDIFFQENIVPTFKPSTKLKPLESELEKKQYAVACKKYQIDSHIEGIEKLTAEIEQLEKHFQGRIHKFNLECNPWDQEELGLQQEEIDLLNNLIQKKKSERKEQIKVLEVYFAQLASLKKRVEEQEEQDDLLQLQKIEEEKQRKEQLLREKQQQEKETELYKWQLEQVEKQTMRPKEIERPPFHPTLLNPWTVKQELQRDHAEQIHAWRLRSEFLRHERQVSLVDEIQNGEMLLSDLHPWEIRCVQEYEEKYYQLQLEMEQIIQQQREENLQFQRDRIEYIWAYWNTKTKIIGRTIKESDITQQLTNFNRMVGVYIANLFHKII